MKVEKASNKNSHHSGDSKRQWRAVVRRTLAMEMTERRLSEMVASKTEMEVRKRVWEKKGTSLMYGVLSCDGVRKTRRRMKQRPLRRRRSLMSWMWKLVRVA